MQIYVLPNIKHYVETKQKPFDPVPIVKKIYNLWQELVKRVLNMSSRTCDDSFAVMPKAKIANFFLKKIGKFEITVDTCILYQTFNK
jgi:hypothetical protein